MVALFPLSLATLFGVTLVVPIDLRIADRRVYAGNNANQETISFYHSSNSWRLVVNVGRWGYKVGCTNAELDLIR